MKCFCTIISPDYLPFASVLKESLAKHHIDIPFFVLLLGSQDDQTIYTQNGLQIVNIQHLSDIAIVNELQNKYGFKADNFRWALKPIWISYLLQTHEKVIYLDPDLYFIDEAGFLFEELKGASLLLSPHGITPDPLSDPENIAMNTRTGLFNAGMVGATQSARTSLIWWSKAILQDMEKNEEKGLFDDQRYLDMLPIIDPAVKILRHPGCNLGSWNIHCFSRKLKNGRLYINDRFPAVFIHFNVETIHQALNLNDRLLLPYFQEYEELLKEKGYNLSLKLNSLPREKYKRTFYRIKHRFLLRTRFKKWLMSIAKKL